MLKFISGVIYTIAMGIALAVAYQHTQSIPTVSGWLGLVLMTILPQLGLAMVYAAFSRRD